MLNKNLFFALPKIQNPTTPNLLKRKLNKHKLSQIQNWCDVLEGSAMMEGTRDSGTSQKYKYKYKYKTEEMCRKCNDWRNERLGIVTSAASSSQTAHSQLRHPTLSSASVREYLVSNTNWTDRTNTKSRKYKSIKCKIWNRPQPNT